MPIKGITTQDTENRLPLLGRIYKGEAKTDPRKPGKDLTYFRVEFSPEYEYLRPIFTQLYGEKPERFERVFLNGSNPDLAFSTWNEEHSASKMIRRCDNEQQVKWFDQQTGEYSTTPIPCIQQAKNPKTEHHCDCKFIGRLPIILPDLMAASGAIGYFLLSTHSIHDIRSLHGIITFIHSQLSTRGIPLQSVPFTFGRVMREIEVPVKDKRSGQMTRAKVKKSMLFLQADRVFMSQLMAGTSLPQIEPPDDDVIEPPQIEQRQKSTNPPPVKHNDRADLGKVEAERTRVIKEIREKYGLKPQEALELVDAEDGFNGWTRPQLLAALDAAINGEDVDNDPPPDKKEPPVNITEDEEATDETEWEF